MSALATPSGGAVALVGDPPLVGRCDELARIEQVVSDAARGVSSGAFVLGDAGTGKSRLLAQAAEIARTYDIRSARAGCLPLSIRLPLDPALELLRVLGIPVERTDRLQRDRLFGSAVEGLVHASIQGPLLICLDDLQWADAATIELVHYCLVRLRDLPMAWLLSGRPDRARAALRYRLERAAPLARIELGLLAREDTHRVAEHIIDRSPSPELVDAVHSRTGGNPLLSVELLRDLGGQARSRGDDELARLAVTALPAMVREAVDDQLANLSPGAQAAIEWAAVLWEPFREAELEAAMKLPPSHALDELASAGLLVADQEGWGFRHPIVRDAIYARLGAADRARRHGHIADSIPEGPSALRATQLEQAGRWTDAARVYLQLAHAGPEGADGVALWQRASTLATRGRDSRLVREADARGILFLIEEGRLAADGPEVTAFRAQLRALSDPRESGRFVAWLGLSMLLSPRAWDPAVVREALAQAERLLGEADLEGRTLMLVAKAWLGVRQGQIAGALSCAREADELMVATDHGKPGARWSLGQPIGPWLSAAIGRVHADAGDLDGALQHQLAALRDPRIGARDRTECVLMLADTHLMKGDLAAARRLLEEDPAPQALDGDPRLAQLWGLLLEEEDQLEEALGCFQSVTFDHPSWISGAAGTARVAVALGDLREARTALRHLDSEAGRWAAGAAACARAESRAWIAEAEQRQADASDAFRQAAELTPSAYHQARLRLEAAHLTANCGQVKEVIASFEAMGAARGFQRATQTARTLGMKPFPAARTRPGALTPRESAVVELIALGQTNPQIAAQLYVSPKTVERHVTHILAKLELRSRVQIATEAAKGRLPELQHQ